MDRMENSRNGTIVALSSTSVGNAWTM